MRIVVISTTIMTLKPAGYSGLEMLAWQCAEGLKAKGHDVLLVAPRGSKSSCQMHETTLGESEQQAYSGYHQRLPEYDVIIDHSWQKFAYVGKMQGLKPPVLGVLHAPVNTMYSSPPPIPRPCLVAISQDQAAACKDHLKVEAKVCYNGVDLDHYKPTGKPRNGRYLFLARFSSIKGPDIACEVAKRCKVALDLVGDDTITGEPDLIKRVQECCALTPGLRYIGPQSRDACVGWFNGNKALLHCQARFREPFGLACVESMMCGMPVIAFDNGACRETIKHSESGFLVPTQEEMEALVKGDAVSTIKPSRCREWASQFSVAKMIDRYELLCQVAKDTGGW